MKKMYVKSKNHLLEHRLRTMTKLLSLYTWWLQKRNEESERKRIEVRHRESHTECRTGRNLANTRFDLI